MWSMWHHAKATANAKGNNCYKIIIIIFVERRGKKCATIQIFS